MNIKIGETVYYYRNQEDVDFDDPTSCMVVARYAAKKPNNLIALVNLCTFGAGRRQEFYKGIRLCDSGVKIQPGNAYRILLGNDSELQKTIYGEQPGFDPDKEFCEADIPI